uniref:Uncharacterized protein AlNc14C24G2450 n=1 Tax=Albugo laibachii Nc14 TaxID=890382 RepID=F0W6F1_9STRA|nr:conserved hypothetical protein [Albugo laibachii Nc14]|eukprot:CCA16695.1 conserved hypothetical protein [Albugo laibachii Nc14]
MSASQEMHKEGARPDRVRLRGTKKRPTDFRNWTRLDLVRRGVGGEVATDDGRLRDDGCLGVISHINAAHLPKHPMYRGETSQDNREFVKWYQDYYNTVLAYETCLNKPFVMPVSACVDVWTKEEIMKFEMGKNPMEVTEQDWINYFRGSGKPDSGDLSKIDKEMRKLRMENTLMDAGSRMSRLRNQVYRILDQHGCKNIWSTRTRSE